MSRSNRRAGTPESIREEEAPAEAIVQTTAKAEVEASQVAADAPEQLLNIEECARNTIVGYQPRWLASIKAFANDHSRGELHTESEWRSLFSAWGATLK